MCREFRLTQSLVGEEGLEGLLLLDAEGGDLEEAGALRRNSEHRPARRTARRRLRLQRERSQ